MAQQKHNNNKCYVIVYVCVYIYYLSSAGHMCKCKVIPKSSNIINEAFFFFGQISVYLETIYLTFYWNNLS